MPKGLACSERLLRALGKGTPSQKAYQTPPRPLPLSRPNLDGDKDRREHGFVAKQVNNEREETQFR